MSNLGRRAAEQKEQREKMSPKCKGKSQNLEFSRDAALVGDETEKTNY